MFCNLSWCCKEIYWRAVLFIGNINVFCILDRQLNKRECRYKFNRHTKNKPCYLQRYSYTMQGTVKDMLGWSNVKISFFGMRFDAGNLNILHQLSWPYFCNTSSCFSPTSHDVDIPNGVMKWRRTEVHFRSAAIIISAHARTTEVHLFWKSLAAFLVTTTTACSRSFSVCT